MARGRFAAILLVALLSWLTPAASAPAPTAAAACPASPLTVDELLALWDGKVLGFMGYVNPAGRHCYGTGDIRVVGYVGNPGAMGYEQPFSVDPGWLTEPGLFLFGSTTTWDDRTGVAPYYALQWPGEYRELQRRYRHDWVSVTAHFDDARARTCTAWDPTGIVKSQAQLRRMCRSLLVISSVTRIGGADTATGGVPLDQPRTGQGGVPWALLLVGALAGAWMGWRRGGRRRREC